MNHNSDTHNRSVRFRNVIAVIPARRTRIVLALVVGMALFLSSVGAVSAGTGSGTFTDDDNSVFESEIEIIAARGITKGCNPPDNTLFCPESNVSRAQMAVFLDRTMDMESTNIDYFVDDDGSWAEQSINRLAAAGILKGCNPPANTHVCPTNNVTRASMAVMLDRGIGWTDTSVDYFVDDDGSWAEQSINNLAAAGVTNGCGAGLYCPNNIVTREQMAAFLVRAFDLTIPEEGTTTTTTVPPTTTTTVPTTTTTVPPTTTTTVPTTTTTVPTADEEAPNVVVDVPANLAQIEGESVHFAGSATDNDVIATMQIAIQNRDTKQWLEADNVTWGDFTWHNVDAAGLGSGTVVWTYDVDLAADGYGASVRGVDASGNIGKATWVRFDTNATGNVNTDPVHVWQPRWMANGDPVTEAQAVIDAQATDVIAAHENTYAGHVDAMHAVNEDLTVYTYVNAVYAEHWKLNNGLYDDHEEWFAHDVVQGSMTDSEWQAHRVYENASGDDSDWGNAIMDPSQPGWQENRADKCRDLISANGYDGCFLDLLGSGPILPGQITAVPVNPATDQAWAQADWMDATVQLANTVKTSNGGVLVAGNGLGWGGRYFDSTHPSSALWAGPVDWMMSEVFIRGAYDGLTSHRGESSWLQDVNMLVDGASRGETIVVTTKVWKAGATEVQYRTWHQYALASFLMGADSNARFVFLRSMADSVNYDSWWDIPIGEPEGPYSNTGTLYTRTYSNGVVYVNPSGSTVTVTLPAGTHYDLDGDVVSGIQTLAPYTGLVVTNSEG